MFVPGSTLGPASVRAGRGEVDNKAASVTEWRSRPLSRLACGPMACFNGRLNRAGHSARRIGGETIRLGFLLLVAGISPALATSGPGCLVVMNVAADDALNLRASPSASAQIVDALVPGRHGIIHLDGECRPPHVEWGRRWCPVTHYNGDKVTKGWVKARFVRDSDCP